MMMVAEHGVPISVLGCARTKKNILNAFLGALKLVWAYRGSEQN
jgi:hypothetical protein